MKIRDRREYYAKYYLKNKEKILEYNKLFILKYPEQHKKNTKKYRENNRELLRLKAKIYYVNNREKILSRIRGKSTCE